MSEALSFTELESAAHPPEITASAGTTEEAKPAAVAVEDAKPQFTDADVAAYQQLVAAGITPQTAEQFKQAKTAMDNLPTILRQNPNALMDEIQKNDPTLHEQLLESFSDRWYQQKGRFINKQGSNGNGSRVPESEQVNPEVVRLRQDLDALKSRQTQEDNARQQERVTKDYNSAFDSLVAKLPEAVPEDKRDYIRLKAEKLLWNDPQARTQVQRGDLTSVPKYFAEASRRVTAETKTAADKEHEARKDVEARGSREIIPAAETVNGTAKEPRSGEDPIWGSISKSEIESAYKR